MVSALLCAPNSLTGNIVNNRKAAWVAASRILTRPVREMAEGYRRSRGHDPNEPWTAHHLWQAARDIVTYPVRDAMHDYKTFRTGFADYQPATRRAALKSAAIVQTAKYVPTITSLVADALMPSDLQVALTVFVADNIKTGLTTNSRWHTELHPDAQPRRALCRVCKTVPCAAAEACG